MTNPTEQSHSPEAQIAALEMTLRGVADAFNSSVENLSSVFPESPERRQDIILPEMSGEQEQAIRRAGEQLGIGSLEDKIRHNSPAVAYVEGGLPHKVLAETALLQGTEHTVVFAGSTERVLKEDEIAFMSRSLGVDMPVGSTEYDMVTAIALNGCAPDDEPTVVPFGYALEEGFGVTEAPTGQLVKVGSRQYSDESQSSIYVLKIDRQYYDDTATGKQKYRQPNTPVMAGNVARYFAQEDTDVTAILTSTTYPSRGLVQTTQVAADVQRPIVMSGYGQHTLAEIKGGDVQPVETGQIAGELRKLAGQLTAVKK